MSKAFRGLCACIEVYPSIKKKAYSRSNEQMGPTDNKPLGPSNEKHVGSSTMHTVSPEQGTTGQDSSNPPPVPLSSPTVSLTSRESFASRCSDHSVVVTPVDGHNPEEGWPESCHNDLSNDQMGPTDNKPLGPNNKNHVGSCIMHDVSLEQGTAGQDSSNPPPVPLSSPTVSLTSSESFASNCSEHSVVVKPVEGHNPEEGPPESCHVDQYKEEIMSSSFLNTLEQSNDEEENLKQDKNGLVLGNLGIFDNSDANDDISGRKDDCSDEEDEPPSTSDTNNGIWDLPEPENEEDDQENVKGMATLYDDANDDNEEDNNENSMAVATLDDDQDGSTNGNGTDLAKPSSLSSSKEGVYNSHCFKDEREKAMKEVMDGKFKNLVRQLLKKFGVNNCDNKNECWVNIVTQLAWQAASFLKPDTTESKTMDPTSYVKVKCIATGSRRDSQLIEGLVFRKHAAHRHMATKYKNPRLLLIQEVLAPSSISSGLASFNSMIVEGSEVKENVDVLFEKLQACRPDVILVEKSTSRSVSDKLLDLKVTLVLDMKLNRLKRIERCTGSPIQSSVAPLNQTLKGCKSLYFEKFVEEHGVAEGGKKLCKTLMFLEGCPKRQGCTILLKGSSIEELKKIKCVAKCAVLMAYHFILETSFLLDQKAMFSTIAFRGTVENSLHNGHSSVIPAATSIPLLQQLNDGGASAEGDQILISDVNNEGSSLVQESSHFQEAAVNDAIEKVSYASPTTFQLLATYIDLKGGKPEAHSVPSSVSPAKEEFDGGAAEMKGSTLENKPPDNHSKPLSTSSYADGDTGQVDDDFEDNMQPMDELSNILDSESILVLTSRRNELRGTICKQSHLSHIKFYTNFDYPLGNFLRENLFNQNIPCEACGEPPAAHFYYYTHHNKQLTIRVKRLLANKLPGESEGKLWMWSRCGKCEPDKEKATKRVLVSTAASGLSFGKFLELSFSSQSSFNRLSNCGHSLQKDFLYFFGLGSTVAMFRYSRVATYTVSVPPQKLKFHDPINGNWLQHETDIVYDKGLSLFAEISGYLKKIGSRFSGSKLALNGPDIEAILKLERSEFEENIKNLGSKNENLQNSAHILLKLNQLRWEILLEACVWIRRLHLLLSSCSNSTSGTATNGAVEKRMTLKEDSGVAGEAKDGSQKPSEKGVQEQTVLEENGSRGEVGGTKDAAHEVVIGAMNLDKTQSEETMIAVDNVVEGERNMNEQIAGDVAGMSRVPDDGLQNAVIEGRESSEKCAEEGDVQIVTVAGEDELDVKELPSEKMLQEGEKHDLMSLQIIEGIDWGPSSRDPIPSIQSPQASNSMPLPSVLGSNDEGHKTGNIPLSGNQSEDGSKSITGNPPSHEDLPEILSHLASLYSEDPTGWVWKPFGKIREECMKDLRKGLMPKFGLLPKFELLHSPDLTVSKLTMEEDSRLHIPLNDGSYIVSDYDGEISSSVACALASQANPKSDENDSLQRAQTVPSDLSLRLSFDQDLIRTVSNLPVNELLVSHGHPEVNLGTEKYPPKGKCSVVILYAKEFRDLRKDCCPSELDFIASLSRCKKWDAQGGKSKSVFAKTLDGRLIIKEIKKTEYESFMKFSDQYFKYMKQSFKLGNQTCLAKILGIYQVTIRNSKTGKETKHDLMVQENLSFGRNITRQYDLKGALHARLVADGTGDVLLDQNFVNDMKSSPLYVGQKAKRLLQRAVWNDTTFLNSINVMDYSLLVGVDRRQRDLVCGIIDYLRQYTWDKQLENWVKTSLVVPKNMMPTIISPGEYKKRFRKFMDTHFLVVPDKWCSQRSSNPCKLCGIRSGRSSPIKPEKREEELNGLCTHN